MSNILKIAAAGAAAAEAGDPNFNQTVLLLHGDGTDGAQNGSFQDSSSNNFTIIPNGNVTQGTFSPYYDRWSNYFDGTGDYLQATIPALTDFTIEGFVYLTASSVGKGILTIGQENQSSGIGIIYTGGGVFQIYGDGGSLIINGSTPTQNEWHYFAVTRSGSTVTAYFDSATPLGTDTWSTTASTSLRIGVENYNGTLTGHWTGYLANIRISDVARTISGVPTSLNDDADTVFLGCASNRFADISTNSATITVNGNPKVTPFSPFAPSAAYSSAVNGGSSYHNASNLSIAQALVGQTTSTFTAEGWVYMTATPTNGNNAIHGGLFHLDGEPATGTLYLSFGPNRVQQLSMGWFDSGARQAYVNETLPLNTWIHIAVSVNSNAIKMFINGEEKTVSGTTTLANRGGTTSKSTIGGSTSIQTRMYGYIADARVSSIARYSGSFSVPTAPLTSDANTTVLSLATNAGIFDNTGKNNLETVGNAQIDTTTKKFGTGSLEFDGTGDALVMPKTSELTLGSSNFTLECWIYTAGGVSQTIYCSRTGNTRNGWLFGLNASNYLLIVADDNGSSPWAIDTSASNLGSQVPLNQWVHISLAREGSSWRTFINGTLNYTVTSSISIYEVDASVTIGADQKGANSVFNGFIDDLRISRVARYTTTFTPPDKAFPDL